ncbi:hypothetical protein EJ08DRAFT_674662 [Tothia fuscella]|uniref:Nuclear segregation protein n=1 Tax=Tothia fuscella TaxID=1048955 RepID=A0A9P4P0S3_9PEZI|nr:hypothetical protein EJ08DRAFT_674662 [Tothia fuscella]
MTDVATPSAPAKTTDDTGAKKSAVVKPERPDEAQYRKELEAAEKDHKKSQEAFNAIKSKLDSAKPQEGSPVAEKRKTLLAELNEIRKTQQGSKESRQGVQDQIKRLDEQIKARIAEQKNARSKVAYKSVEDVDREIDRLQKQVDTGMMKLVDEKKALAEISSLHRQKKGFAGFDQAEKGIADIKAKIAELRKQLDDPKSKAQSERYNKIQAELDEIKAEQDGVYKNLNGLRDQRTKLHAEQQEKWQAIKAIKDKYFEQKRAFREYDQEAWRIRKEKQKAENDAFHAGKRKEVAARKLEEASAPAYQDEILTAEGLIRHFDPSALPPKEEAAPSKFAASAQRTVGDAEIKGMKAIKKDDEEDYFKGSGGKKKGKGKKGGASSSAPAASSKFTVNIGILEDLNKVKVDAPSGQDDIPKVVEQLKEKVSKWKADQDKKTKENIAKAQKEIERLEAEENSPEPASLEPTSAGAKDTHRKPATKNQGVNGHASAEAELVQEKDAVADATEDLEKAKIEDDE